MIIIIMLLDLYKMYTNIHCIHVYVYNTFANNS